MDAQETLGEPRLLINRDALRHNVTLLREAVGPTTRICAVIKADGYGHGAALVARALTSGRMGSVADSPVHGTGHAPAVRPVVDMLAVATIEEAALLPTTGLGVLIFRPMENTFVGRQRARLEHAIRQGWVLTVCSAAGAGDVARVALGIERRANVQVMIDTGMTRAGVDVERAGALLEAVRGHASLRLWGAGSHFACSEVADHAANAEQLARFRQATDGWAERASREGWGLVRNMSNSGAIFNHRAAHLDMVRAGIALYGIDPACRPDMGRKLRPVMRWVAPLLAVRAVKAGTAVGYGLTWAAPCDTHIGLVPVGYADGYMRAFSGKARVIINGRSVPVVGRVSMDLITIDLGAQSVGQVGDEVTLLDSDPLSPASAYQLAELGGTIPYELFCGIGSRIHRVEVEDAQRV